MASTGRRKRIVYVVVAVALVYLASHMALSRYSHAMLVEEYDGGGFYYVPCDPLVLAESETLQGLNFALLCFYYPVWMLDHYVLGGPHWAHIPAMEVDSTPRAGASDEDAGGGRAGGGDGP